MFNEELTNKKHISSHYTSDDLPVKRRIANPFIRYGMIILGIGISIWAFTTDIALSSQGILGIPWSYILIFLCMGLIGFGFISGVPHRKGRVFVDANGNPELITSREYHAHKANPIAKFFSLGKFYLSKWHIQDFEYENGHIKITTKTNRSINGDLKDLIFRYGISNDDMELFYIENPQTKEKLKLLYCPILLADEEWNDIFFILSQCGTVKETKISKLTGIVTKVQDADFSSLLDSANSVIDIAGSIKEKVIVRNVISEKYGEKINESANLDEGNVVRLSPDMTPQTSEINLPEKSVNNNTKKRKKGSRKKWLWISLVILGVLIFCIGTCDSSSEKSNYMEESYETDETVEEDAETAPFEVVLSGKIGKYPIEMKLNLKSIEDPDWCEVEGIYRYTKTGNGSFISVWGVKQNDNLDLTEVDADGNPTGYFYGTFTIFGRLASFSYEGKFVTTKGKEYEFYLSSN